MNNSKAWTMRKYLLDILEIPRPERKFLRWTDGVNVPVLIDISGNNNDGMIAGYTILKHNGITFRIKDLASFTHPIP